MPFFQCIHWCESSVNCILHSIVVCLCISFPLMFKCNPIANDSSPHIQSTLHIYHNVVFIGLTAISVGQWAHSNRYNTWTRVLQTSVAFMSSYWMQCRTHYNECWFVLQYKSCLIIAIKIVNKWMECLLKLPAIINKIWRKDVWLLLMLWYYH